MRKGGEILGGILAEISGMVRPGVATIELDDRAVQLFAKHKVEPAFLGY